MTTKSFQPMKQWGCNPNNRLNILMFIMDRCNFSCPYCYNRKPRHLVGADLSMFLKYVQDIRNKVPHRPLNVSLIGGEPTLHKDMLEFCDQLMKIKDTTVEVLTNFHKPFEYYLDLLERGILVSASWHGQGEDSLNWSFVEKALKIPQRFIDNCQVEIRVMMENSNWSNSKKVFTALYPKCRKIMELSLLMNNDGTPYEYSEKQISEYKQFMMLLKGNNDYVSVTYENGETKRITFQEMYLNPMVNFHLWRCNAGLDYIYVHVNGDVYNCQSYYEHNLDPMYNIVENGGNYETECHRPCICQVDYCSCDFEIHKERILKAK